jgi:hypothetical protein
MSKMISFAVACATLGLVSFGAQAFPVSSLQPQAGNPDVTLVEGGCGPGFHRGEFNRCRPNERGVVVVRWWSSVRSSSNVRSSSSGALVQFRRISIASVTACSEV